MGCYVGTFGVVVALARHCRTYKAEQAGVEMLSVIRVIIILVSSSFQFITMKTISILATIVPFLPTFTEALVGLQWSVANVSSSGLTDITFPISIANAPHQEHFYFAQQFGFVGLSDIGYTGLQPRPNSNGSSIIHAAFSSFVPGSRSSDKNCANGADGGPGVSCSVEIPATYTHLYNLVVKNTAGTTWTGTVVDAVAGSSTHIGSYTLPSGAAGIMDSQLGFIENYVASRNHSCHSLPYTNVTFGAPRTTTSGAGSGRLDKPYEYGDCVGKVNFDVEGTSRGYEVSVGFKNA